MGVLIVDDGVPIVQSLSTILSVEGDVEVVGLGCSGPEATERYRGLTPDIFLVDVQMPGGDELNAAERIPAGDAGARIVFLTTFSDDGYIIRALKMRTHGYLIKQGAAQAAPVLRSVMAGICILGGKVLECSTTMGFGGPTRGRGQAEEGPGTLAEDLRSTALAALTDREYGVVKTVTEGPDNVEAAAWLFMNEGTVRNHISAILAKLGLCNRTQVAVMYYHCAQAG